MSLAFVPSPRHPSAPPRSTSCSVEGSFDSVKSGKSCLIQLIFDSQTGIRQVSAFGLRSRTPRQPPQLSRHSSARKVPFRCARRARQCGKISTWLNQSMNTKNKQRQSSKTRYLRNRLFCWSMIIVLLVSTSVSDTSWKRTVMQVKVQAMHRKSSTAQRNRNKHVYCLLNSNVFCKASSITGWPACLSRTTSSLFEARNKASQCLGCVKPHLKHHPNPSRLPPFF